MPYTEGLGREFNLVGTAKAVWINMRDCEAVTFLGVLAAGDTYTIQEAQDNAGTGAQNLPKITNYYTSRVDGTAAWARNTIAANSAVTTAATTQGQVAISIGAVQLSDGYGYVKCTSTGAGLVIAITHDLDVQRTPANLPPLAV